MCVRRREYLRRPGAGTGAPGARAPDARLAAWRAGGAIFYYWPTRGVAPEQAPRPGETLIRLVTSFETSDADVESFLALASRGG